jgi:hypothetical protein
MRLPNRRHCDVITFESMGMRFTASVSRFPDGRIGEIFLDNHKQGSAVGTLVRDLAIAFSFAAQHGADVEAIRRALCRDSDGNALGPLGRVLDLILGEPAPPASGGSSVFGGGQTEVPHGTRKAQ